MKLSTRLFSMRTEQQTPLETSERPTIPANVLVLGYAGLLPPFALILADWLMPAGPIQWGGIVGPYAAVIYSFLGGSWWAFAVKEDPPSTSLLVLAVSPPLLALLTFFAGPQMQNILLAILIAISPGADYLLKLKGLVPPWWMRLRFRLSMGLAALTVLAIYPTYFG
ncbi:DUF3429 domain-containing protein [Sphingomicrobium marinum]|uniref:DUF3429 domain-containing protein n=1 Tax=Sphingomicrobium marinum TaxID=1227950 RepID=UPI0022401FAE|nr:DUF3429 domain-containing protein [Sphingomicrobium marinum]